MFQLITFAWLGRLFALPIGHLALWGGLVCLTIGLIALAISKRGRSHPLYTCGVLSLLAHVLLACIATIVRIVAGFDQVAEAPPIRVRLVEEEVTLPQPAVEPQPVVQQQVVEPSPQDNSLAVDQNEAEPAIEKFPDSPEQASEQPLTPPTQPVEIQSEAKLVDVEPDTSIAPIAVSKPETKPEAEINSEWAVASPAPTEFVSAPPTAPDPYANRQRQDRLGFVEREGGSRETEAAVRAALHWLSVAQSKNGRWDASMFGSGQEQGVLGHNRGGAGASADTGVSALALLAYLGAGYTHHHGEYRDTVRDGLQYLMDAQAVDGNLSGNATRYARMYCHSMATFALAEAMALSGDNRLEASVRSAIDYSLRAQHQASGGWRYRPGQEGDTSQLGWQLMALRSGGLAGVYIPPTAWTRADRFLRSVARGPNRGLAAYTPKEQASRTMTAEALYCRLLLSGAIGGQVEERVTAEATEFVLAERPGQGSVNLYYWYYATLALHHQKDASPASGEAWRAWNAAMKRSLVGIQVLRGPDAGSWSPNTMWGGYGGRVYSTSLAALCLEVYYRYLPKPSAEQDWIARDPAGSTISR